MAIYDPTLMTVSLRRIVCLMLMLLTPYHTLMTLQTLLLEKIVTEVSLHQEHSSQMSLKIKVDCVMSWHQPHKPVTVPKMLLRPSLGERNGKL